MSDPFSTVAAAVSFADVTIRACGGLHALIARWNDAPNTIQRTRQTLKNLQATLGSLRLYVVRYESSKFCLEQQLLLPDVVKNGLRDISLDLGLLQQLLPPSGSEGKLSKRFRSVLDMKKTHAIVDRLDKGQIAVTTGLQILGQKVDLTRQS